MAWTSRAVAVAVLGGALCAALADDMHASPEFAIQAGAAQSAQPPEGAAILEKAREAIGGTEALDAVKSLVLTRHDKTTTRILLPDRFQSISDTPWGPSIDTLEGVRHWRQLPKLPNHLASKAADAAPPPAATLARNARWKLAEHALKYLLRPPPDYPMSRQYVAGMSFGPVAGDGLVFTTSEGHWVAMVFDPSSGMPRAQVTRIGGDPAVHGTHLIEELRAYKPSGGILVPHEIAIHRVRPTKIETMTLWRFSVEVNPPLTADDFVERSEK